ncbi:unnamed protein product [Moneuplotes crassus]|uniref:Uncharacterized protein n=1 Tax=Euplotes crassus TaxID=5936 RepID=A0AAD1Y9J9_EUPCR|nr:unnamed protein product [Moneuplotes crassus]
MNDLYENHAKEEGEPQNFDNYKGLLDEEEEEKYIDPQSGAHFEFTDFCSRLKTFNKCPDNEKYERNHNSHYYSFDSKSATTASCLFDGSEIKETPSKGSDIQEEEPIPEAEASFKFTRLHNFDTINSPGDYKGAITSRSNGVLIPKILLSKTTDITSKPHKEIKRVNKLQNIGCLTERFGSSLLKSDRKKKPNKSPMSKKSKNNKNKFKPGNSIKIRGIESKPMLLNLLTNCTKTLKRESARGPREDPFLTDRRTVQNQKTPRKFIFHRSKKNQGHKADSKMGLNREKTFDPRKISKNSKSSKNLFKRNKKSVKRAGKSNNKKQTPTLKNNNILAEKWYKKFAQKVLKKRPKGLEIKGSVINKPNLTLQFNNTILNNPVTCKNDYIITTREFDKLYNCHDYDIFKKSYNPSGSQTRVPKSRSKARKKASRSKQKAPMFGKKQFQVTSTQDLTGSLLLRHRNIRQ